MNTYHFMYSDLKSSGLLQQSTERNNRMKVVQALDELIKNTILLRYDHDERKVGRKIVDVKYTVYASMNFITEQKAASKRKKNGLERLPTLDKSI